MEWLFVIVPFVVVGLLVIFYAFSGGGDSARQAARSPRGKAFIWSMVALYVVLGLVVPAAVIAHRGESEGGTGSLRSKEVSGQLEDALPPGIETQGDVEDVLRLISRAILKLHRRPGYLGFFRMVVADSRQFPWIAEAFAAVMEPLMERFARYLAHLTAMGILDCRNPMLAAHQFTGILNEFFLWPWLMGRDSLPVPAEDVIEETIRMFLRHYRLAPPKGRS